ncbi:MAG TPA: hypothetical protein PKA14_26165, partial [Leptospiraceae bacterium]|nr:hypothetical protein [Leptospiraceae bacterium]
TSGESRGINFAKIICRRLEEKLEDNYLKHIINNFIFLKKNTAFEEKYYSIPAKQEQVPPTEEIKIPVSIQLTEEDISEEKKSWKTGPLAYWALSAGILLSAFTLYSALSYLMEKPSGRYLLSEYPSEWPQPNTENLYLETGNNSPKQYIYRKRDYAKTLTTFLFPSFKFLEKEIPEILKYSSEMDSITEKLESPHKKMDYSDEQDLFDRIYPLDKNEQLIIFHNEIMKNTSISHLRKAKLLRQLYRQNLTRMLYRYSTKETIFLSDFAEAQSNKQFLMSYLLYLVSQNPGTELAAESLIILEDVLNIQERFTESFSNPEIEAECKSSLPYEINPLVKLSCRVYKDYKHYAGIYNPDKEKFQTLRMKIFDYALLTDKTGYSFNEIYWRKAFQSLKSSISEKRESIEIFWKYFSMIRENKSMGYFNYKNEYKNVKDILFRNRTEVLEFLNLEKELKDAEGKTADLHKKMLGQISRRSKLNWELYSASRSDAEYEKLMKREKAFLYPGKQP